MLPYCSHSSIEQESQNSQRTVKSVCSSSKRSFAELNSQVVVISLFSAQQVIVVQYVHADIVGAAVCGERRVWSCCGDCDLLLYRRTSQTEYGSATHILDRSNACNNLGHKDLSNCYAINV